MHSIGFHIKDIDVSQLTFYLTKNIATVVDERSDIDFIVFQQSLIRPAMRPPFAILHERELWSYQGIVVTTTLDLAKNLYAVLQPQRKVFYVADIEWIRSYDFESNFNIYTKLDLIAENQTIATILENQWKKPIGVAENYNVKKMLEILKI